MTGKEIMKILNTDYSGAETILVDPRCIAYSKAKNIRWLMYMFDASYGVARRLVDKANHGIWEEKK